MDYLAGIWYLTQEKVIPLQENLKNLAVEEAIILKKLAEE